MADFEMIRPINLPQAQELADNDVFVIDSTTGGVRKIPKNKVYTPVDDTLTESGEAADAKVTGEKIDEVKAETALIQNPVGNKSGELVSFSDGANMPAISVIAHIEPVQSGSGTGTPSPDNVRPISGWESVETSVCGKNLFCSTLADFENGTDYGSGTFIAISAKAGTYTMSTDAPNGYIWFGVVGDPLGVGTMRVYSGNPKTITLVEDGQLAVGIAKSDKETALSYKTQLEVGSTATEYTPYIAPTTHNTTTSLGRTVYGGTLDVVSGVLTDKMGIVDLGSLSWAFIAPNATFPYGCFYADVSGKKTGTTNIIADSYKTYNSLQGDIDNGIMGSPSNNRIFIVNSAYSDANTFKTAMSGKYVCYELATPQTYTLTPTQINTLLGENNVWADAGAVEVTYRRDINLALSELEQAIISLGSNV